MTKKEDFYINFSGFAHDHTTHEPSSGDQQQQQHHNGDQSPDGADSNQCSVIAILRRHPMYDSLVLVKKYRACLNGYSLEFPVDESEQPGLAADDEPDSCRGEASLSSDSSEQQQRPQPQPHRSAAALLSKCSRRRLVSRLIDGDDPKFQHYLEGNSNPAAAAATQLAPAQPAPGDGNSLSRSASSADIIDPVHPFSQQTDDRGDDCQFVHVPLNGLLHRLKHFTESGLAVDSRVYSFAMGLKFAERILTTNSMKEVQETPI